MFRLNATRKRNSSRRCERCLFRTQYGLGPATAGLVMLSYTGDLLQVLTIRQRVEATIWNHFHVRPRHPQTVERLR